MHKLNYRIIELRKSEFLLKELFADELRNKCNVIINAVHLENIKSSTLELLKKFSVKFEYINKSFILVSSKLEGWEGVLVPTMAEAEDYLEMEEIERQLKI